MFRLEPTQIQTKALAQFYLEQAIKALELIDGREAAVAKTNAETALLWANTLPDEKLEQPVFKGYEGAEDLVNAAVTRVTGMRATHLYNGGSDEAVFEWNQRGRKMEISTHYQAQILNDPAFLHLGAMLVLEEKLEDAERRRRKLAEDEAGASVEAASRALGMFELAPMKTMPFKSAPDVEFWGGDNGYSGTFYHSVTGYSGAKQQRSAEDWAKKIRDALLNWAE